MKTIHAPAPCETWSSDTRRAHRKTVVFAGGLTILSATLALVVHPGFAAGVAIGGLWLMLTPDA